MYDGFACRERQRITTVTCPVISDTPNPVAEILIVTSKPVYYT